MITALTLKTRNAVTELKDDRTNGYKDTWGGCAEGDQVRNSLHLKILNKFKRIVRKWLGRPFFFFLAGVGGLGEGHACTSFSLQKRVVAAVVWWNITVQNKTVFGRQPQPTALDTTGLGRGWGSHYWTSERDTFVKGDLSCRHCLHTGGIMLYLSYCLNMLYYLIRRYLGQDFCRVWNIAQKSEGCAKMIPALIVGACGRVVV